MGEAEGYRKCPKCSREIRAEATLCGYCWTKSAPNVSGVATHASTVEPQKVLTTEPRRFKKCKRCGKLTREIVPKCWNCKAADFENERVVGTRSSTSVGFQQAAAAEDPVRCPRCGSTQVTANKKGFGLGKALVGGVLTGGVGLLAGFLGSGKVIVTCVKCGKQWKVGG